ncbi:MAG: hypothetical protein FWD61_17780 [Phycisphaerales bacterium]|nr:hypothetical protein [Phycisphaerales bacterium]
MAVRATSCATRLLPTSFPILVAFGKGMVASVPVAACCWESGVVGVIVGIFSTADFKSKIRGSVYRFIVSRMSVCRMSSIASRGETPDLLRSVPNSWRRAWMSK